MLPELRVTHAGIGCDILHLKIAMQVLPHVFHRQADAAGIGVVEMWQLLASRIDGADDKGNVSRQFLLIGRKLFLCNLESLLVNLI